MSPKSVRRPAPLSSTPSPPGAVGRDERRKFRQDPYLYIIEEANRLLNDALDRNAQLARALEFVSQNCCLYRARGQCLMDCTGAILCNLTGLKLVQPETIP